MFNELLEPRRLMAVDVRVDGYGLFITGTKESESIEVRAELAKDAKRRPFVAAYVVLIDGKVVDRQPPKNVPNIVINARGGRDTITGPAFVTDRYYDEQSGIVFRGLATPAMHADGGTGNDRITGGAGDDTLIGGDGHDLLLDTAGRNALYGGDGDDRLDARDRVDGKLRDVGRTSGYSRDTIDGGYGRDLLSFDRNDTCHATAIARVQVGNEKFRAPSLQYTPAVPVAGGGTTGLNFSGGTFTNFGGQAFQGGLTLSGGTYTVPHLPDDADEPAAA